VSDEPGSAESGVVRLDRALRDGRVLGLETASAGGGVPICLPLTVTSLRTRLSTLDMVLLVLETPSKWQFCSWSPRMWLLLSPLTSIALPPACVQLELVIRSGPK